MKYLPWRVGKRIEYLFQRGRSVEAMALIVIEWDQVQLCESLFSDKFAQLNVVVGESFARAFVAFGQAASMAAKAMADFFGAVDGA